MTQLTWFNGKCTFNFNTRFVRNTNDRVTLRDRQFKHTQSDRMCSRQDHIKARMHRRMSEERPFGIPRPNLKFTICIQEQFTETRKLSNRGMETSQ